MSTPTPRMPNPMRHPSPRRTLREPSPIRAPRTVRTPSPMRVPHGRNSMSRPSPQRSSTPTTVRSRSVPRPISVRTSEEILADTEFRSNREETRDPPPSSPVTSPFPPKSVKVSHKSYIDLSTSGSEIKIAPSPKKSRSKDQQLSPFSYSSRQSTQYKQKSTPPSSPRALQPVATSDSEDHTYSTTDSPSTLTCSIKSSHKKMTVSIPRSPRTLPKSYESSDKVKPPKSSLCSYIESARSDDTEPTKSENDDSKSKSHRISNRIDDMLERNRNTPRNRLTTPTSTKSIGSRSTQATSPRASAQPSSTRSSSNSRGLKSLTSATDRVQLNTARSTTSSSATTLCATYKSKERGSDETVKVKELEAEVKKYKEKLKLSNERVVELDSIVEDIRKDQESVIDDIRNEHECIVADLTKNLENSKISYKDLIERNEHIVQRNSELEMEVKQLQNVVIELKSYEEKSTKQESYLTNLIQQNTKADNELQSCRAKIQEQESIIEHLNKQCADTTGMRERMAKLSHDLKKSEASEQDIEELKHVVEHTKRSYTQLAKSYDNVKDKNRKLDEELKTLIQGKESQSKWESELVSTLEQSKESQAQLESELAYMTDANLLLTSTVTDYEKESNVYKARMEDRVSELAEAVEYLQQSHNQVNEAKEIADNQNIQLKEEVSSLNEALNLTNEVKEQLDVQMNDLRKTHEEVVECYKQLQSQAEQNEKQYDANFSDAQQLFENKLQEKSKLESELRHKLESANKAVRELRDAGLKRGKQISALLKEKNANQNFISELQSSKEKESLELQSSLDQVRQHFKVVESQYVEKLVLLRKQFDDLRENHLIERDTMLKKENDMTNEMNGLKQFISEKEEKLLWMEKKENDLLQDIESITNAKGCIEADMATLKDELDDIQNKLDASQQHETEMQDEIIELKSIIENLQQESSEKVQAHDTMTKDLEEKIAEVSAAKLHVENELEQIKIEYANMEMNLNEEIEILRENFEQKKDELSTVNQDLETLHETSTSAQKKLEEEKSALNNEMIKLKSDLEERNQTLTDLESQFTEFQELYTMEKLDHENGIEALKASHAENLESVTSSHEDELKTMTANHDEKEFKMQALNAELDILKEAYTKTRTGLKQKEASYTKSMNDIDSLNEENNKLHQDLESTQKLVADEKEQNRILEVSASVLESNMSNLQQRLENIRISKSLLEAEDRECEPCIGSIDEIVEHIDVMCDDKNTMIQNLESDRCQLEQRLDNMHQRSGDIFVTKALFSNEDSVERSGEDEVKSMDDLVSSIEAMCDDKNTMIKQLLEESETMKNVYEEEAEERSTYAAELEERLEGTKSNLNSMQQKASELANTLDEANSTLNEKESRIKELEEHVILEMEDKIQHLDEQHAKDEEEKKQYLTQIGNLEEENMSTKLSLEQDIDQLKETLMAVEEQVQQTESNLQGLELEREDLLGVVSTLESEQINLQERLLITKQELKDANIIIKEMTGGKNDLLSSISKLETDHNNLQAKFQQVGGDLSQTERKVQNLESEKNELVAVVAKLEEEKKQVEEQLNKTEQSKLSSQEKLEKLEQDIVEAHSIITDCGLIEEEITGDLSKLVKEKGDLQGLLEQSSSFTEDLKSNVESLKMELEKSERAVADLGVENEGLRGEISRLEMERSDVEWKLQESESFQDHLQEKLNEATETINTLKELFAGLEQMVEEKDHQLSVLTKEIDVIQDESSEERTMLHGQMIDMADKYQYLNQQLKERNNIAVVANKVGGVVDREALLSQLKVIGTKMQHVNEMLREKDEQLSKLSSDLKSSREQASTEVKSMKDQVKEITSRNEETDSNKDSEITTLEDILLEKGVHISDLSSQIEGLKDDIAVKEKIIEELSAMHKQEKHALQESVDKATILQDELELRLEQIIDESARTKKNLQTVTKEASKTKTRFEDKIFELNSTLEDKTDTLKQVESSMATCEARNTNLQEQVTELETLMSELEIRSSSMKSSLEGQIVKLKFSINEKDCQLIELAQELDNITEKQAIEQRSHLKVKKDLEHHLQEATTKLTEATELSMRLNNELHSVQSEHSMEKQNQQETMQNIISELMSASKTILGKDDQGMDNATVATTDSLSAFLDSHHDSSQPTQTDTNYTALRSALGLNEVDNGDYEVNTGYASGTKKRGSLSRKDDNMQQEKSEKDQTKSKSRSISSEDFGAKVNQVEKRIDNYVESFSTLVTDLSNFATNVDVDADVTKQKENRNMINEETMSTVKKSTEVSVDLQASKVKGDNVSRINYNMRENATNLNSPLSMDEYVEGFSNNQQVEVFLQVSGSATEYTSSADHDDDLKDFNTNSGFSSELLDSYDSYTDDYTESGGSYTSGSI